MLRDVVRQCSKARIVILCYTMLMTEHEKQKNTPAESHDRTHADTVSGRQADVRKAISERIDTHRSFIKEKKRAELAERREKGEISPFDLDLNLVCELNQYDQPLTRKDMQHESGEQALVLTRDDFDVIGCLDFILVSGKRMVIEPESLSPDDVLIVYLHEVGNEEMA